MTDPRGRWVLAAVVLGAAGCAAPGPAARPASGVAGAGSSGRRGLGTLGIEGLPILRDGGEGMVETRLAPFARYSFCERSCRDGIASACFRRAWTHWSRTRETDRDR